MTPHTLTPLGHDIFLVHQLLDPSLCTHLIDVAECQQFQPAHILVESVDVTVRNNDLWALGGSEPLARSTNDLLAGQLTIVQRLLFQHYGIDFPYVENCSILRYREGHFYQRHVDNILLASRFQEVEYGIPTRDISIVGYLNDDFDGGETYFDRQDIKVKPETGAVLVFPAYYTHPHESLPVTRGQKYAFTSWLFH